jgi:hypothetical protein
MKIYEYRLYNWAYSAVSSEVLAKLNELGAKGWHVVGFSGREYVLEREQEAAIPQHELLFGKKSALDK